MEKSEFVDYIENAQQFQIAILKGSYLVDTQE